jgi:AhpD family alkylhydroperoxidase
VIIMPWHSERLPETMEAFSKLRETIFKNGALDVKTKELISVTAAVLMRCEFCVQIHSKRAKEQGATEDEIAEAISVAMFVAAGSQLHWTDSYEEIMKG